MNNYHATVCGGYSGKGEYKMKKSKLSVDLEELEKITDELESEELDLEIGLEKFKKGLALAKEIKKRLLEIENQIIEVKKDFDNMGEEKEETPE